MSKKCPLMGGIALYLDCLECEEKMCKRTYKYDKVVIGLDQSYQNTGICVIADGVKKHLRGIPLKKYKSNSERRAVLGQTLNSVLKSVVPKAKETVCIIERIRLFSGGKSSFININYIKSIGALEALIVDICKTHEVTVYSVDTRCWKSQVVGTSKPQSNKYGVDDKKWPTVQWCINKGWEKDVLHEVVGRKRKGTFIKGEQRYMYDDDIADSAAIATFGFVGEQDKLKEES